MEFKSYLLHLFPKPTSITKREINRFLFKKKKITVINPFLANPKNRFGYE